MVLERPGAESNGHALTHLPACVGAPPATRPGPALKVPPPAPRPERHGLLSRISYPHSGGQPSNNTSVRSFQFASEGRGTEAAGASAMTWAAWQGSREDCAEGAAGAEPLVVSTVAGEREEREDWDRRGGCEDQAR